MRQRNTTGLQSDVLWYVMVGCFGVDLQKHAENMGKLEEKLGRASKERISVPSFKLVRAACRFYTYIGGSVVGIQYTGGVF